LQKAYLVFFFWSTSPAYDSIRQTIHTAFLIKCQVALLAVLDIKFDTNQGCKVQTFFSYIEHFPLVLRFRKKLCKNED